MTAVDHASLANYLNDHLSGSVAALQLMDRICAVHLDNQLGEQMTTFRREIEEEQTILRAMIERAGGSESILRKSLGWLAERLSRFKIGPGSLGDSGLQLFEALELLAIGFYGRRALWRALDHAGIGAHLGRDIDFATLAARADEHLESLERLRLAASTQALQWAPPLDQRVQPST